MVVSVSTVLILCASKGAGEFCFFDGIGTMQVSMLDVSHVIRHRCHKLNVIARVRRSQLLYLRRCVDAVSSDQAPSFDMVLRIQVSVAVLAEAQPVCTPATKLMKGMRTGVGSGRSTSNRRQLRALPSRIYTVIKR